MAAYSSSLVFTVTRREPELIVPAEPTPHEFKQLSDIDGQESLRFHVPIIQVFPNNNGVQEDPVRVIRKAIAKALVFYYPLAGRIREGPRRKLSVECTGEGLLFIEAEADVKLDQFSDADLLPPFPCLDQLLYAVPDQSDVLNCPILLIQVTRLKCGGFIVTIRLNHTMCDGAGICQFLSTVGEFAHGATQPFIPPVWDRHLLTARNPPCVTHVHLEFTQIPNDFFPSLSTLIQHSFFFRLNELSALRRQLPPHLAHHCSTLDILTALLWICRTIAMSSDLEEEVRVMSLVNIRSRLNPPLPVGYYGNGIVYPAAVTTVRKLTTESMSLEFAVEKVRQAKVEATEAYVKSMVDLMEVRERRPVFPLRGSLVVSDLTKLQIEEVDYGWGKPVYSGVAKGGTADIGVVTYYMRFKNREGEEGVVVPMALTKEAMIKFENELIRRGVAGAIGPRKINGLRGKLSSSL
ncbi:hypothetical protein Sjap_008209 [Stephania japonica]|uniref:Benzyl alcohol O-benzoyltransferase n=1 Tax=Stephania japonica TaxID=461633 RepID=A0AAP0JPW3_9MAGN